MNQFGAFQNQASGQNQIGGQNQASGQNQFDPRYFQQAPVKRTPPIPVPRPSNPPVSTYVKLPDPQAPIQNNPSLLVDSEEFRRQVERAPISEPFVKSKIDDRAFKKKYIYNLDNNYLVARYRLFNCIFGNRK